MTRARRLRGSAKNLEAPRGVRWLLSERMGDEVDPVGRGGREAEPEPGAGAREVALPDALRDALCANPAQSAAFDALASSHQQEFARWIAEAKRDETRERRVARALQMLRERNAPG